jgi:hypothetical protein
VSDTDEPRGPDFVDRALHSFDHVLDLVHDRVLRPILIGARAVAFGFIILFMALVLLCVLVIGLIRLLNVYLFTGHEWLSYAIIGSIFLTAGLLIWRRRRPVNIRK